MKKLYELALLKYVPFMHFAKGEKHTIKVGIHAWYNVYLKDVYKEVKEVIERYGN